MTATSQSLRTYLLEKAEELTEKWLSMRESEDDFSIYSNHMPDTHAYELRENNLQLIQYIAGRIADEEDSIVEMRGQKVGEKRARFDIPIYQSMEQFIILRKIFWEQLEDFLKEQDETVPIERIMGWAKIINYAFDEVTQHFTHAYFIFISKRLKAQEQMIDELSAPFFTVRDGLAVLLLIGDFDSPRAKMLIEQTLNESMKKAVNCLIIDLSGVFVVNTLVAQEFFKIIAALRMTGVDVSLAGMRPELAHSAARLGIRFGQINIYSNVEHALKQLGIFRR